MSGSPRIVIVITSRASYARVATVIGALREQEARGRCSLDVVWAGSAVLPAYGDVSEPGDDRIYAVVSGVTPHTSALETGLLLIQLSGTVARARPQLVVSVADRHETIATAIAASYQNIPLAHVQGGETTGQIDDRVRHAVSMLADLHFPSTAAAGARLVSMGVRGPVFAHGCPSIDLAARVAPCYVPRRAIVVLQHAVTDEDGSAGAQAHATCAAIRARTEPVVWLWPGEDAGAGEADRAIRQLVAEHRPHIQFRRHLPATEFLAVLASARCLVGNSSVGIREGSYLGTPTVNIGTRQHGRERASNVLDVPHDVDAIAAAIDRQVEHGPYPPSVLYGDGTAGPKIAASILEALR